MLMLSNFLDANVFLYAIGVEHPLRDPCRAVLRQIISGALIGTTSAEVIQEILYYLIRRGRREEAFQASRRLIQLFPDLLPVT